MQNDVQAVKHFIPAPATADVTAEGCPVWQAATEACKVVVASARFDWLAKARQQVASGILQGALCQCRL